MSKHMSKKISQYGVDLFVNYLRSKNKDLQIKTEGNYIMIENANANMYYVMTKKHTVHSPGGVEHLVTGINEEALERVRSKAHSLGTGAVLVFVDVTLKKIYCITLQQWDIGGYVSDVQYPCIHLSPIGGRIIYYHLSLLDAVYKLTDKEYEELKNMAIQNKQSKDQLDLFIK